jgi:hypothetical protein
MDLAIAGRRPTPEGAGSTPGTATVRRLWSAEDLIRLVLAVGTGGIVLVVSWYVCSGDASFNLQFGPLDVAVAGLVVAGLGNVMWLLRGRRAVGERRRALLPDPVIAAVIGSVGETRRRLTGSGVDEIRSAGVEQELLVAGEGLVRFHRSGCALAAGRTWTISTRQEHEDAGRLPCGVCKP